MLIMDEVQRLKNWKTQIAQAARKITSRYAVILSGTPLENRLEELFSVMQLVDQYCLGPFYKFKNLHIETSELGKVIAYKNLNQINCNGVNPEEPSNLLNLCLSFIKSRPEA